MITSPTASSTAGMTIPRMKRPVPMATALTSDSGGPPGGGVKSAAIGEFD